MTDKQPTDANEKCQKTKGRQCRKCSSVVFVYDCSGNSGASMWESVGLGLGEM